MSRLYLTVIGILFLSVLQNVQSSEADFSFDIDGDGETEALTDGLLVLRYLFGFSGTTLSEGAVSSSAGRADAGDISAYLSTNLAQLDVDGDGETGALTDGLLLLRYLFGFRDETLIAGALVRDRNLHSRTHRRHGVDLRYRSANQFCGCCSPDRFHGTGQH